MLNYTFTCSEHYRPTGAYQRGGRAHELLNESDPAQEDTSLNAYFTYGTLPDESALSRANRSFSIFAWNTCIQMHITTYNTINLFISANSVELPT